MFLSCSLLEIFQPASNAALATLTINVSKPMMTVSSAQTSAKDIRSIKYNRKNGSPSPSLLRKSTYPEGRGKTSQRAEAVKSGAALGSPFGATTTTAASGGLREELLGQRPARYECNLLHEVTAGCHNPASGKAVRL